jgi:drug/metabolite transporter (DMT)-like permease
MKTKKWAIALVILCTLFTSSAQFFFKKGADALPSITIFAIAGLACYAIGALFLMASFKGGEVTVLYPIFSTSFIWVVIISKYALEESVGFYKWLGIAFIIAGIIFISTSKKSEAVKYEETV